MTLKYLSIWTGCLLLGLTGIFMYLSQVENYYATRLEMVKQETEEAKKLANDLSNSITIMSASVSEYLRTGNQAARQNHEAERQKRDGFKSFGDTQFEIEIYSNKLEPGPRQRLLEAYRIAVELTDQQRKAMDTAHDPGLAFNPARRARIVSKSIHQLIHLRSEAAIAIEDFRTELRNRSALRSALITPRLEALSRSAQRTFLGIQTLFVLTLLYLVSRVLPGFERIRVALHTVVEDDFNVRVVGAGRSDEVGDMARAVVRLQDKGRKRTKDLYRLAYFDTLTDLPNRAVFRDRLSRQLEALGPPPGSSACLAIYMVDLDKFKEINDIHGHPAGDIVLKETARRLQSIAGLKHLACRFGGDEFGFIALVRNENDALELGDRILTQLRGPIAVSRQTIVTPGSTIGLATTNISLPVDRVISQADVALYGAKEAGRGQLKQFQPGMDAKVAERRELEEDLRGAGDRGELSLALQPQVDLRKNELVGFEALMRWKHPKRGNVSPGVFVPIAEESRQILEMGRWSIKEACQIATAWPAPWTIAINLSPAQFYDQGLVPFVVQTLKETKIAPERVEIEITESVLIDDRALAFRIMHELRATGVSLALDDFGTGFSSLSYLREFPFDKIKIDRSFVIAIEDGSTARAIVRSIVGLGDALGMTVLAEGIETPEQSEALMTEGCHYVQGYLYGKPMPSAQALAFGLSHLRPSTLDAFEADSREEALAVARAHKGASGSAA